MSNLSMQGGSGGTGTVTLLAPSTSTDRTLTLPDATGTVALQGGAGVGKVLQVVSATKTDTFSTTSTSFVDVTGLSVSITPTSATSKILVFFTVYTSSDQNSSSAPVRLVRDSTAIDIGDAAGSRPRISGIFYTGDVTAAVQASMGAASNNFLDAPATTSALTYKIQMASSSGPTMYVNRSSADRNTSGYDARAASSITVMEIAA